MTETRDQLRAAHVPPPARDERPDHDIHDAEDQPERHMPPPELNYIATRRYAGIGLLVVGLGLCLARPSAADVTLKQVVGSCQTGGGGSCTITPGVAVTAGNALVVVAGGSVSNNTLASVTATSHSFTVLDAGFSGASAPWVGDAYECSAAAGSPVFTVTMTSSGSAEAIMYELQGNASSSCADATGHTGQTQASPGTGPNGITSTAVTPTNNGVFFIAASESGCCAPPTMHLGTTVAWTDLQTSNDGATQLTSEEFAQATAGSIAGTFQQDTNVRASTLIIGISPSAGAATAVPATRFPLLGVGGPGEE